MKKHGTKPKLKTSMPKIPKETVKSRHQGVHKSTGISGMRNRPDSKGIDTVKFRKEMHLLTLREKTKIIEKNCCRNMGNPFILDEAEEDNDFTEDGVYPCTDYPTDPGKIFLKNQIISSDDGIAGSSNGSFNASRLTDVVGDFIEDLDSK